MKRIRKIFCVVLMSVSLIGCGRIQDSKLNSDVDNNVNITQKKEDSIYVEKDNLNESEIVNAETQDKSSKEQIKYNDENTFLYSEYILNQKKIKYSYQKNDLSMSSFGWNTSLVENDDYYFDEIITDFYDLSNNQKVEIAYFDSNNDGIKEMVVKLISKIENDYLLLFSYHQEGLSLDYIIENSSNCSFQIDQFGIIYGGQASAGAACAYSEELYDSQKIHLLFTKESYFWDSVYEFDEELFAKYYDRYECPDDIKYINVSLQNGNSKELFFTYKKMQDENVNMKTEDEILQSIISELESKGRKYISYDEYLKKIQDEYNRYNIVADPDNHVEVIYQEILNL